MPKLTYSSTSSSDARMVSVTGCGGSARMMPSTTARVAAATSGVGRPGSPTTWTSTGRPRARAARNAGSSSASSPSASRARSTRARRSVAACRAHWSRTSLSAGSSVPSAMPRSSGSASASSRVSLRRRSSWTAAAAARSATDRLASSARRAAIPAWVRQVGRRAANTTRTTISVYAVDASRARLNEVTPSRSMVKMACAAKTSSAPEAHSQAGRLSATSASSQPVPTTDQSTEPLAPCARRSKPIATTTATATAIAIAACALVRPPARARGTSQAAAASMPSQAATGTAGWL